MTGFFMVVEKKDDKNIPYWLNFYLKESHPKTFRPFINVLKKLKIYVPDKLLAAVIKDSEIDASNRNVFHS